MTGNQRQPKSVSILGYSDPLSVAPGETVTFMVTCTSPSFTAEIIRHGLENECVAQLGPIEGSEQSVQPGSYLLVPTSPSLEAVSDFTIQMWLFATTPAKGLQGLLTKWNATEGSGYGLFLRQGQLALAVGSHGAVEYLHSGRALRERTWYYAAASFDAATRVASLVQQPLADWSGGSAAVLTKTMQTEPGRTDAPLLIAACARPRGSWVPEACFNGKIDSPRLVARASRVDELELPGVVLEAQPVVGSWDFGDCSRGQIVRDLSDNHHDAAVVNMPARGVTGHNWKGRSINFQDAPEEFSAIHFHDDDLDDARWAPTFTFEIPIPASSGVYSADLRSGDESDSVPFIVRPPRDGQTAEVAWLAPTFTYMAYGNYHSYWTAPVRPPQPIDEILARLGSADHYVARTPLLSLYDRHSDGSGVGHVSRRQPLVAMRPSYIHPQTGGVDGLGADLTLVRWLEAKHVTYDVISDEDLHHEGTALLARYRVVLTGSHPEYWTESMLDSLEGYLRDGGRLMYLGGNGFYWVASVDPDRGYLLEVRRGFAGTGVWRSEPGETFHASTGEPGGLWRHRGRAPQRLVGVGFAAQGHGEARPYRRCPDSLDPRAAFVFQGVDHDELIGNFGIRGFAGLLNGAAGLEIDRADERLGTPPDALLLASADGFSDKLDCAFEEIEAGRRGSSNENVRADMVYFETGKGGKVFAVGSIAWCLALEHDNYSNSVSQITENVLREFSV